MTAQDYPLLSGKMKYTQAFCDEDEIAMAETIRKFVDKEVMPFRHDMEGGWHHDHELAIATLHRLYKRCVDLGLTKTNLAVEYGGTGFTPVVRQMINEELLWADIGLATMVGKIHWIVSFMAAAKRDDLLREFAPLITEQIPGLPVSLSPNRQVVQIWKTRLLKVVRLRQSLQKMAILMSSKGTNSGQDQLVQRQTSVVRALKVILAIGLWRRPTLS